MLSLSMQTPPSHMQCASIDRLTGLLAFSRENVHASHAGAIVEENLDRAAPIFLPDFRFAVTLSRGFTVTTYISTNYFQ